MLQQIIYAAPEYDLKIVMGDFKAKIGKDSTAWEEAMGQQGLGKRQTEMVNGY
jgi:hypothetical protein